MQPASDEHLLLPFWSAAVRIADFGEAGARRRLAAGVTLVGPVVQTAILARGIGWLAEASLRNIQNLLVVNHSV